MADFLVNFYQIPYFISKIDPEHLIRIWTGILFSELFGYLDGGQTSWIMIRHELQRTSGCQAWTSFERGAGVEKGMLLL